MSAFWYFSRSTEKYFPDKLPVGYMNDNEVVKVNKDITNAFLGVHTIMENMMMAMQLQQETINMMHGRIAELERKQSNANGTL